MKIKKYQITILIIFAVLFFALPTQAQSPDDLSVIFNPNPLFSNVSFAPGQSASGLIEIRNKSGAQKQMAIEAINVADPENFGDILNAQIWAAGQNYFNNTLTEFFQAGEVVLSNLPNNASTTYELIITFNSEIDNTWQGKTLNNFDILIGFLGEDKQEVSGGGGTDSGGGGGSLPAGLTLADESISVLEINEAQVIITWLTNYFSTSQVIYSAENEPHVLDLTAPNFGYAHATVEDLNKVTFHNVTLIGLNPGTTYYYRTVSQASPPTISREYSFTTSQPVNSQPVGDNNSANLAEGRESASSDEEALLNLPVSEISQQKNEMSELGGVVAGEGTEKLLDKEVIQETAPEKENEQKDWQLSYFKKYWWPVIVLLIIIIILIYFLFLKNKKEKLERR